MKEHVRWRSRVLQLLESAADRAFGAQRVSGGRTVGRGGASRRFRAGRRFAPLLTGFAFRAIKPSVLNPKPRTLDPNLVKEN